MRLLLLVLLVGCHPSDMDYPVGGGGTHGGGGTLLIDAATDGSATGPIIATACVLSDARDLTSCAMTGAAGLTVTLGGASATTAADGSFTIARPTTAGAVWDVTGSAAGVVESVTAFTGQTKIPVMDIGTLTELQSINGHQLVSGTGVVLARVARGGMPVPGETAQLAPLATYDPLYDPATSSTPWATQATGTRGTVFVDGVSPGTATMSFAAAGMTQLTISAIPIADSVVTFVFAELP